MSRLMGKPTICIGENKGADQLRGNREADQRLCFRYSDSTIPPLLKSEISSFWLFSVTVQVGMCRTCSDTTLLVFPRGGSNVDADQRRCALQIREWEQIRDRGLIYSLPIRGTIDHDLRSIASVCDMASRHTC